MNEREPEGVEQTADERQAPEQAASEVGSSGDSPGTEVRATDGGAAEPSVEQPAADGEDAPTAGAEPDDVAETEQDSQPLHLRGPNGRFELVTAEDFVRRSTALGDRTAGFSDEAGAPGSGPGQARRPRSPRSAADPSRADLRRRVLARAIDVAIFALLSESITYVGPLVALVYLLLADGLFDGASVGKRLTKLQVVRGRDGKPASVFDSLLRNAPLGIAGLFVLIPLIGWALFLTLGMAVVLFEGYMVFNDPKGVRAGDILAGTQVRDSAPALNASSPGGPPPLPGSRDA
ncbi:MAG: RDD family protein [Pseudomonadota bacterium]